MADYSIREFHPGTDTIKQFDCGNSELNGFLLETDDNEPNATLSQKELMATTYIVEDNMTHEILAYFSLLHDKIDRRFTQNSFWNSLSRAIPNAKRRRSYPALKIGKLAVCQAAKAQGLGSQLINYIEWQFLHEQRAGCRFITVDSLREAEVFYGKNYFKRLADPEPNSDTVLMYFDLKSIL